MLNITLLLKYILLYFTDDLKIIFQLKKDLCLNNNNNKKCRYKNIILERFDLLVIKKPFSDTYVVIRDLKNSFFYNMLQRGQKKV